MDPESAATPETRLLLRALAPAGEAAAVATLLDDDIDWAWLVETAEAHGVTVLLFRRLLERAPKQMPPEILAAATVHGKRQDERNRALCAELLRVIAALEAGGVAVIPFKGPVLAERAYGDLARRRFRDLDFLIKADDAVIARRVLGTLGYDVRNSLSPAQDAASRRYAGQEIFFRRGGHAPLEPHWALAPHTLALDLDYVGLWQRAEMIEFAGQRVRGLRDEDLMLTVCLHGSKEQWVRLQWVCDVAYLVTACPRLDWPTVLARATQQGCRRMVLIGLALARDLLAIALPEPVTCALAVDGMAATLAAKAASRLFASHQDEPSIYELTEFRILMRERWRDRLRYVLRTVLTPREIHFAAVRLPDALFFLYPAVKLIHDYAALPLWNSGKRALQRPTAPKDEPT